MQSSVSIIVPAYNRPEELDKCLESIRSSDYKAYEIVVIDDCSTDDLRTVCKKHHIDVYHRNEKNLGPTISKNIGITLATGNYLWFLDSDTEILGVNVLSNMVSIMESNPDIGCLGGELYCKDLNIDNLAIKVHKTFINGDGFPQYINPKDCIMIETVFLASANCFTRADLCNKVNGFEDYYYYLYEDTDFCHKINELGYKIIADYRCSVLHMPSKSSRFSSMYKLQRNRLIFVLLNKDILTIIFLPFWDVYYNLKFFKEKRKLFSENNTVIKTNKSNPSFTKGVINFALSIFFAYLYNIVFLPKTLSVRVFHGVK